MAGQGLNTKVFQMHLWFIKCVIKVMTLNSTFLLVQDLLVCINIYNYTHIYTFTAHGVVHRMNVKAAFMSDEICMLNENTIK